MMEICVVSRAISFGDGVGGLERASGDHVRALTQSGVSVQLVIPAPTDSVPPEVSLRLVPWPSLPSARRGPLFYMAYWMWTRKVRQELLTRPPQIAHFHGASVNACEPTSYRAVFNPHGMEEFSTSSRLRWVLRSPLRMMCRKGKSCDVIISTDERLTDAVIKNFRVNPTKVVVIPNAVRDTLLNVPPRHRSESNNFKIVTVGRLVHNKGYDILLKALAMPEARDSITRPIRWTHFGSGPLSDSLLEQAKKHQVDFEIREGRTDSEVQAALRDSDVFVQPSRYEGSSLTVLEAMALGAVVVATPVGGIPDKVHSGVDGFLADGTSAEDLCKAIVSASQADRSSISSSARSAVRNKYTWRTTAATYKQLYHTILGTE